MEQSKNAVEQKPVFMPRVNSDNLVKTDMVRFERHVGFASRQKKKSINDMHQVIRKKYGFSHVLELSSKSGNKLSFLLSPLSLKITNEHDGQAYSVENALQASKVFENGGWSLEPLTAFYDWLYVNALKQNPQLHEEVMQYQAFTDREFNPKKSIHCAAYSLAMFVALNKRGLLDGVEDPIVFYDLYHDFKVSNTAKLLENGLL